MSGEWQQKVEEYCYKYNIPIQHLADTLYEPKVVPMIRGKAFEFSVMMRLQSILPKNEWRISKTAMSEDVSFHDTDVQIFHTRTGRFIRVECKLVKKESYRLFGDGHSEIRVKCMRSRTLGAAKVKEIAPKLGIDERVLSIHNDQYLAADFDMVITSIGNAFYRTDKKTGTFEWKPRKDEEKFLSSLGFSGTENLKDFAFNRMYIAKAKDIAVRPETTVVCTRRGCKTKNNCGFIPNYPIIRFDAATLSPTNGWVPIEAAPEVFKSFIIS